MFRYGSDHSGKTKIPATDVPTTMTVDLSSKIKFDPPKRCR